MAHHNPFVECPYNMAHQVPKLRMQQHLLKCRKNNPHLSKFMKSCPFNATHIMPERELEYHLRFCENRSLIEGQKYNLSVEDYGELGNPAFHVPVPKETWDDTEGQERPRLMSTQKRPESEESDPYLPGGALGVSLSDASTPLTAGVMGLGRGRLYQLLEMKKNGSS